MRWFVLLVGVAVVGCGSQSPSPNPVTPAEALPPMTDSTWTWVYMFDGRDAATVSAQLTGKPHTTWEYSVERVTPIRGTPSVTVDVGATLLRVEVNAVWSAGTPSPLFRGVVRHQDYTTSADRSTLVGSRTPPALAPDTRAVLIPIRKTSAWWALPANERAAQFQRRPNHPGHTEIGAKYIDRIYRKLYHTRYAVETTDHDFLTYFEFEKSHEPAFDELLAKLRDVNVNPEWEYVDREYEIRMRRTK
jgi:hypothetical protein